MRALALAVSAVFALAAPASADDETIVVTVAQTGNAMVITPIGEGKPVRVEVGDLPASIVAGPDGRTLYITQPDRGRVTVADAITERVTASFPIKGQPFGAAATDEFLYVSDWTRGVLHKIDVLTGATLGEAPVGKAPAHVVIDKAGTRAFVAAREADEISIVDLKTMTAAGKVAVGKAPFALALSPDETRLYVANVQSGDLSVIDVAKGEEIKRVKLGRMPYGVAVTPDGKTIAVTLQHDGALAIIDAATLETRAKVKVGSYPEGVSIDPSGKRAAVANWFDDTISIIDLATAKTTATLPVEGGPRTLVALGR